MQNKFLQYFLRKARIELIHVFVLYIRIVTESKDISIRFNSDVSRKFNMNVTKILILY